MNCEICGIHAVRRVAIASRSGTLELNKYACKEHVKEVQVKLKQSITEMDEQADSHGIADGHRLKWGPIKVFSTRPGRISPYLTDQLYWMNRYRHVA